jgi:phage baseplate assembly protein W
LALIPQANALYTDVASSLFEHPVTREIAHVQNESAIKQAVRNLIMTNFYERPFQPQIGCGIRGLLFEPMTVVVQRSIEDAIKNTITNFEPRVRLLQVKAVPNVDENHYSATIVFALLNSTAPIELTVLLKRVR